MSLQPLGLPTPDEKGLIVRQVGDTDEGLIASIIDVLWDHNSIRPTPELQFLYTKRDALDVLAGQFRGLVRISSSNDLTLDLNKRLDNVLAMRKTVQDEILVKENRVFLSQGMRAGTITAVEPITPPTQVVYAPLDANDTRFKGDPYKPGGPGQWYPR